MNFRPKNPELVIKIYIPVNTFISFFLNVFIPIGKGKKQINYKYITVNYRKFIFLKKIIGTGNPLQFF
jgi:hypothetical protein